jgi:predicted transcriptional regulator of viral defense system
MLAIPGQIFRQGLGPGLRPAAAAVPSSEILKGATVLGGSGRSETGQECFDRLVTTRWCPTSQLRGTISVAPTTETISAELAIDKLGRQHRFLVLLQHKFFGRRRIGIKGQGVTTTHQAKTVVDRLDCPEYCDGVVEAAKGRGERLFQQHSFPETLVEYADRMKKRTMFKRRGYLAELFGLVTSEEIEQWQNCLLLGYALPDLLAGDRGPYDSRWRLRLNRTTPDLTDWMVH